MFKGQTAPPRTRRQYFPSKKQIRYFMAKAKASLDISHEAEMKLEAQVERLKESRSDEKMIFNFRVKHEVPLDLSVTPDESINETDEEFLTTAGTDSRIDTQQPQEAQNAKLLFCHQTPHQQRLLKRYSSQVILTEIKDIHSKIPFPLFCLYVQTNVNYQLVGEFILQSNGAPMIMEGLQSIKDWNPGWNPKFVVVDFTEEQITAVENVFPGIPFILLLCHCPIIMLNSVIKFIFEYKRVSGCLKNILDFCCGCSICLNGTPVIISNCINFQYRNNKIAAIIYMFFIQF